ncbi:MAG: HNH endonuclease [Bacillota bacterium]
MAEEAINFILNEVIEPALNSEALEQKYKNKVQHSKNLIRKFKKVGDLYKYLKRFENSHGSNNDELYNDMKKVGLKTFEDIYPIFKEKFKYKLDDVTTIEDFIIGERYSSYDIAIFSEMYNVQPGIYLIGDKPNYQAIFIKATLENGDYPNEWITENKELKYYMYALRGNYDPEYKYNEAIINSNDIPIYVFIKDGTVCTLNGIYEYVEYVTEEDGRRWFRLKKANSIDTESSMTKEEYDNELHKKIKTVEESNEDVIEEEKAEYDVGNEKPEEVKTLVTEYKRDPNVIVKVLKRANGICEMCNEEAPFIRKSDGSSYLEVHHIEPLSEGGADTVNNAVALCPNCHAKVHYGVLEEDDLNVSSARDDV